MTPSLLAARFQSLANLAVLFLLLMYLQGVRHLSPIHASLLLVPGYLVGGVVGPFAGRFADRRGAVLPATFGLGVQVVALLADAQLGLGTQLWPVAVAYVVGAVGPGCFFPSNNSAVTEAAPGERLGIASGDGDGELDELRPGGEHHGALPGRPPVRRLPRRVVRLRRAGFDGSTDVEPRTASVVGRAWFPGGTGD